MLEPIYYNILANAYCYNPTDDSIVKVDKDMPNALQGLDTENINLINSATDDIEILLDRNMSGIILQTTQNCNLRCTYCPYVQESDIGRSHNDTAMKWNIAEKAIDFLHEHSVDSNEIRIIFYGGEPTLNMDLITKAVEYSEEKFRGKKRSYFITTNATLLSNTVLDFMQKYSFELTLSIDGDKKINDKNRRFYHPDESVFEVVFNKIQKIYNEYPKLFSKLLLNFVLDPSVPYIDYKNFISKHEVLKAIVLNSSLVNQDYTDNKIKMCDDFKKDYFYDLFLLYLHILEEYDFSEEIRLLNRTLYMEKNFLFNKSDNLLNNFSPNSQCIAGLDKLMIDINGNFYPCEKVNEKNLHLIVGNVFNGFNFKRVKELLNFPKEMCLKCKSCFAIRNCAICSQIFIDEASIKNMCDKSRANALVTLRIKTVMSEIQALKNNT